MTQRSPESCRFRTCPSGPGTAEVAQCGLIAAISGTEGSSLAEVGLDACRACSDSFEPTPDDLNPVVASLLFHLAQRVIESGGCAGCSAERARELQSLAEDALPALPADLDDGFDTLSIYQQSAGELSLERIRQLLPAPRTRCGPAVRNWAVGVTTAPRRQSTLDVCLDSLNQAGWSRPVIFQDGELPRPPEVAEHLACVRTPRVGPFPNFFLSLVELYMRDADADAYMLVQDDAVFPRNSPIREYLEGILWPGDRPCLVSLYTASDSNGPAPGWHRLPAFNSLNGALALVYPRTLLKRFVTNEFVLEYRERSVERKLAGFPDVIRDWRDELDVPVFLPTPSLVQHIGQTSTIWTRGRALADRFADQFLGDMA